MQRSSFPVCCGAQILASFSNTSTAIDGNNYTPEQIGEFLDKNEGYDSLSVAILNEEQIQKMGKEFKKRGFVFGKPAYHPAHGTYLRIVYKANREPNPNRPPLTLCQMGL